MPSQIQTKKQNTAKTFQKSTPKTPNVMQTQAKPVHQQADISPQSLSPSDIMTLQRSVGNMAVSNLLKGKTSSNGNGIIQCRSGRGGKRSDDGADVWFNNGKGTFKDNEGGVWFNDGKGTFKDNDSKDGVWFNDGKGTFDGSASQGKDAQSSVPLADVSKDNDTSSPTNEGGVWFNDGKGTFKDNDSKDGVWFNDGKGTFKDNENEDGVWFNDGKGTFKDDDVQHPIGSDKAVSLGNTGRKGRRGR